MQTDDDIRAAIDPVFLWEKTTDLSAAAVVHIVKFAKKIPGFMKLSKNDQIVSLRAACLEIMVGEVMNSCCFKYCKFV